MTTPKTTTGIESLPDELARLAEEYHDGEGSEKDEAWNLVADCVLSNLDEIVTALRTASPRDDAGVREAIAEVLAYEKERANLSGLSDCTCMSNSRESEAAYEAGECPHQKARAALQSGSEKQ